MPAQNLPAPYLAVCAIFRDEAAYLEEWVRFHQAVGVGHCYLYDNQSTDRPESVLAPHVAAGQVTLIPWPTPWHQGAQRQAYADCLARARRQCRWLAFIDLDEFLFSPSGRPLPEVLRRFESAPGVVVHWQVYGSSGHASKLDAPVIERFTRRAPTTWVRNRKVKSIVDPRRTLAPLSVHHFAYAGDAAAVDETGRTVRFRPKSRFKKGFKRLYGRFYAHLEPVLRRLPVDPYKGADIDRPGVRVALLRINHYPVKSRQEFLAKARLKKERRRYEDLDYFSYHDRNEIEDKILVGYPDRLSGS